MRRCPGALSTRLGRHKPCADATSPPLQAPLRPFFEPPSRMKPPTCCYRRDWPGSTSRCCSTGTETAPTRFSRSRGSNSGRGSRGSSNKGRVPAGGGSSSSSSRASSSDAPTATAPSHRHPSCRRRRRLRQRRCRWVRPAIARWIPWCPSAAFLYALLACSGHPPAAASSLLCCRAAAAIRRSGCRGLLAAAAASFGWSGATCTSSPRRAEPAAAPAAQHA